MEPLSERISSLQSELREARREAARHELDGLRADVERLQAQLHELGQEADEAREAADLAERNRDAARERAVAAVLAYQQAVSWASTYSGRLQIAGQQLRQAQAALEAAEAGITGDAA